jgi:lathosterol oxidase
MIVYFVFATLSYLFVFDHATMSHPRFLKNQIRLEMVQALTSMPVMALFTAPCFWAEINGYSKMYDTTDQGPGLWYNVLQFPLFLAFTDYWIYWIHRGLHHPLVYKVLHKPHHKWIMPTPYASHAFHPIDGFAQSVPYHVFPFLLPMQKWAYVALFVFINFWTIMIHDGEFVANNPVVNGAACHAIHHMEFTGNYGQFSTPPDRLGGTYKTPEQSMFVKGQGIVEPRSVKPLKVD